MGKYFGTDGIRGEVGKDLTLKMAYAIGKSLKDIFNPKTIVIGKDTRESSQTLAMHIASGAMSCGIDVIDAGVVSTPMIAYFSKTKQMIGIMITASHNPFHDNGIKLFNKGVKLTEQEERNIEAYFDHITFDYKGAGSFTESNEVINTYLEFIHALPLKKTYKSVLIDSANGANTLIASRLMSAYTKSFSQIGNTPNGKNINLNCGSTHLEHLKKHMNASYDIGFSFDGDGDRVLVMDHEGNPYDGDMIIYIIARYLKSINKLTHNTVVLTKMSNPGIVKALKAHNIKTLRVDVGDKYVHQALTKHNYVIGGENSGHIIYKDFLDTGDGLLIALLLLTILEESNQSLKALTSDVVFYPQKMVNIKNVDKNLVTHELVVQKMTEVKKTLGDDALILLRPSGTEPLIRVTLAHKDETLLDQTMEEIVTLIQSLGDE